MASESTGPRAIPARFDRTQLLLGPDAIRRLMAARVVVVGLGAVGSYATEALARAAVGHLRLVDFDVIRESNINRQLYALGSTVGRPKVEVARERVKDINPDCEVEVMQTFFDSQSAARILAGRPDVVVDAIDSAGPKIELIVAAIHAGLRIVSSMGAATRTDPLAVRVGDVSETRHCPLARYIRKHLRHRGIAGGVRCVYSTEPARKRRPAPDAGGAAEALPPGSPPEAEHYVRGRTRAPLGSVSYLTGMFGLVVAREAVELILTPPSAC